MISSFRTNKGLPGCSSKKSASSGVAALASKQILEGVFPVRQLDVLDNHRMAVGVPDALNIDNIRHLFQLQGTDIVHGSLLAADA